MANVVRMKDVFRRSVPVMGCNYIVKNPGLVLEQIYMENTLLDNFVEVDIPYYRTVQDYLATYGQEIVRTIVVVCDDFVTAKKAVMYLNDRLAAEEIEENMGYEYFEDDEMPGATVRIIDFAKSMPKEKGDLTNNFLYTVSELQEYEGLLFKCYGDMTDARKLETILVAKDKTICFLVISKEQLKEEWLSPILVSSGVAYLRVVPLTDAYYVSLLEHLLSKSDLSLAENFSSQEMIRLLRKKYGNQLCDENLAFHVRLAILKAELMHPEDKRLRKEDLELWEEEQESALSKLQSMTGLSMIKKVAKDVQALEVEKLQNPNLKTLHNNMIFSGNPGSGKTTCAKLLADCMAEVGYTKPKFISVCRKDLIGEFVGQTAPKVADAFRRAKGGILFVDEAGFFLEQGSGGFLHEAMREFVRFMELDPSVTVIFAMYESETEQFLKLDAGLASRINRVVKFEDYSKEELFEIAGKLAKQQGYCLMDSSREIIYSFIEKQKKEKKESFGNAREMRNLIDMSIHQLALRHCREKRGMQDDPKQNKRMPKTSSMLKEDVAKAIQAIEKNKLQEKKSCFGFQMELEGVRVATGT